MIQFKDILKMLNSAQNQYLQLRDEEDGADTWLILITGCLNSRTKFTIASGKQRESAMSARKSNQSDKSRLSHSSKNSYFSSYSDKSRSIKARKIERKAKHAELQVKI